MASSVQLLFCTAFVLHSFDSIHLSFQVLSRDRFRHDLSVQALLYRALKSIIAESYGPVGQAKVIGYSTAGFGIGAIAGPAVGGLLTAPCDTFLSGSGMCNQGACFLDRYNISHVMFRLHSTGHMSFMPSAEHRVSKMSTALVDALSTIMHLWLVCIPDVC